MTGAGNLEKDLLLPFEKDLAIVDPAGQIHQPVHPDQLFGGEAGVLAKTPKRGRRAR